MKITDMPCVSIWGVVHWAGTARSGSRVKYMALPSLLVAALCQLWANCETKCDDGEWPTLLHYGHCPGCKRPTQGLYLCSVVDLEREMPASPCFLAHRRCTVSVKYGTMMFDTVSPPADSSIQNLPVSKFSRLLRAFACMFKSRVFNDNERT